MLEATWKILLELAPWLLLGAAIAGVLHVTLPAGFLRRRLRGRGGVVNAVLFGVPLPLCSCGVIPTGLGLKKQGASDGATVGFLISTPQTGVDSVLVTAGFLGWPFSLFKLAFAAVTGVIGGWIADAVSDKSKEPDVDPDVGSHRHAGGKLRAGVEHAMELIRTIWRWLVVGVLLSAAITAYVPTDGLESLAGYGGLPGMLAALVISLPLYVCATASAPIAASLVAAGLPVGAALVFLMAGPATNVATIGAIYRTLGRRQLVVYLTVIIVGSILGGLLFGWVIDSSKIQAHLHEHEMPWWATLSAVILLAMLAWFAINDARQWLARMNQPKPKADEPTTSVNVEGMTCQNCVNRLTQFVAKDPEVSSVEVTLDPGRVTAHGKVTAERLKELVKDAGYTATQ